MRAINPHDAAVSFAAVLDALPIVAFLARPDGTVSFVSHAGYDFIGQADDVSAHQVAYEGRIHPDQLSRVLATWFEAVANDRPYRDEYLLRRHDDRYRWVLAEANPLRDLGGQRTIAWFGVITDIDERKRFEASLRAQAEFAERLIESSADCLKIVDLDARLTWMNRHGQTMLAIDDVAELIGTSWLDYWAGPSRAEAEAAVVAARAGATGTFSGEFRTVGGKSLWFDVVITAIKDAAGLPEQLLIVSRDVSERRRATEEIRESERRFLAFSEALPGVMWTATPDGALDFISERWAATRGRNLHQAYGFGWVDGVHPADRAYAIDAWRAAVRTGRPYDVQFRAYMSDGTYRWQLVRAHPQRDADGRITRWVGVNIDIDEQRKADEARAKFVALAENSGDLIGICNRDGVISYLNEAGRALLEIPSQAAALAMHALDYFCSEDRPIVRGEIARAIAGDGRWAGDFQFRNVRTGAAIPVAANVFRLDAASGTTADYAMVGRDLRAPRRVERGLSLLSRTGAAVVDSLDYMATLRNFALAFIPDFAAYCIIDVITADGEWQRTLAHRDPTRTEFLENLSAPDENHPITFALNAGVSTVRRVVGDDVESAIGGQRDRHDAFLAVELTSYITVPVVLPDGVILGGLTCGRDRGDESIGDFVADDLPFVQEVGRRAGAAIANARLYERERRIAVELQAASLPSTLPSVPNLRLDAEYRPGSDEATIGGDWYDAIVLPDGRVAFTVGDVLGHGLGAAVRMTKLRQSMQAAAMVDPDPQTMLRVADQTLRLLDADGYATAIAALYDPVAQTLTLASAGHPGPVVRAGDGTIVMPQPGPGLMLGLRRGDESDCCTIAVGPGATIVFFTDGLVEATRDYAAGVASLRAAVAAVAEHDEALPAQAIVRRVLGHVQASDDIAVLVARIGPAAPPA